MTGDVIEMMIIVFLLCAFGAMSIWVMLLIERIHQLKGYIERMKRD